MRKNLMIALVVEAVVLIVAFALSVACIQFGVGKRALVMNLSMIVLLVLVSGALMFFYWWRVLQRDEMARRFYVSKDWIYNHEIGHAPISRVRAEGDAYDFVTFMADALAKMSYGFEVADAPEDFSPELVIDSREFHFHFLDENEGDSTDGVVIDRWKGALQRVSITKGGKVSLVDVGTFGNAAELAGLIEESMDFVIGSAKAGRR